jgi:hypothetical protein
MIQLGAVPILINAMSNFLDDLTIQQSACTALYLLVRLTESHSHMCSSPRITNTIVDAMMKYERDSPMQITGAACLCYISQHQRHLTLDPRTLSSVVKAMRYNGLDLQTQQHGCVVFFLVGSITDEPEFSRSKFLQLFVDIGALSCVVHAMNSYLHDETIHSYGSGIFMYVAEAMVVHHKELKKIITNSWNSLQNSFQEQQQQQQVMRLAQNGEITCKFSNGTYVTLNIPQCLLNTMANYLGNAMIQEHCCTALAYLSSLQEPDGGRILKELNTKLHLNHSMAAHPNSPMIQAKAQEALNHISQTIHILEES